VGVTAEGRWWFHRRLLYGNAPFMGLHRKSAHVFLCAFRGPGAVGAPGWSLGRQESAAPPPTSVGVTVATILRPGQQRCLGRYDPYPTRTASWSNRNDGNTVVIGPSGKQRGVKIREARRRRLVRRVLVGAVRGTARVRTGGRAIVLGHGTRR
jgi:hypothetical protein